MHFIPTHILCVFNHTFAEENLVGPVRMVFLSADSVIVDWRFLFRAERDCVGQIPQRQAHGRRTAVAQLHKPRKAQRVLVAGPRAIQFFVVENDFFVHQGQELHLAFIQFLHDA